MSAYENKFSKLPKQKRPTVSRQVIFALSEWGDLNSRPLDPQSSALTRLRYTPLCKFQFSNNKFQIFTCRSRVLARRRQAYYNFLTPSQSSRLRRDYTPLCKFQFSNNKFQIFHLPKSSASETKAGRF